MKLYDRPSSNPSGAAAVRQADSHTPSAHEEQPPTEVRAARVAQLRARYESGAYQVEAAELSSKIIDQHLKK